MYFDSKYHGKCTFISMFVQLVTFTNYFHLKLYKNAKIANVTYYRKSLLFIKFSLDNCHKCV